MDRKKFLQLSSSGAMAGMALAAFPKTLLAKTEPESIVVYGWWSRPEGIQMNAKIFPEAIKNYDDSPLYRTLALSVFQNYYDENGDFESSDELLNAGYKLNKTPVLIDAEKQIYRVEARKFHSSDTTDFDVDEVLTLEVELYSTQVLYIDFEFSNRSVYLSNESEACFLTSACTRAKGLPDDCKELETLRAFRDDYMAQLPLGKQLIQEYAVVGPAVVQQINRRPNAMHMYASIYDSLVLPSIELIREGRKEDAMCFYKKYVEGLNKILA